MWHQTKMWHQVTKFHHSLSVLRAPEMSGARKTRVFHLLLNSGLYLVGTAVIITTINYTLFKFIWHQPFTGASPIVLSLIWLGVWSLFRLSMQNHQRTAIFLFLILLWLPAAYTSLRWGALFYQALIIDALVIVLAGILASTRLALIITAITSIYLISLTFLQQHHFIPVDLAWRNNPEDIYNAITVVATLWVITLVSWLYNHELQHALQQMIQSQRALKKERDSLDQKVKLRTQQLKAAQAEKMMQWQQFVELGRSAAEVFHDIKNPLSSASLNLEQLCETDQIANSTDNKKIQTAFHSIRYIGQFITAIQCALGSQTACSRFDPARQIRQALRFLSPKAKTNQVKLLTLRLARCRLRGSPHKFHQVVANLVSNAIDACCDLPPSIKRQVSIDLKQTPHQLILVVQDNGSGILPKDQAHIFTPLFTTKPINRGTGLGLTIVKTTVENDFHGQLTFRTQSKQGTTFTVTFPLVKNHPQNPPGRSITKNYPKNLLNRSSQNPTKTPSKKT
ncbi:HAMP domain-containing histidine kinase [Patescibacteria group bacterium]|nr:HAMP domain-containing histidine kinase [Patescibacteria group bacterium]